MGDSTTSLFLFLSFSLFSLSSFSLDVSPLDFLCPLFYRRRPFRRSAPVLLVQSLSLSLVRGGERERVARARGFIAQPPRPRAPACTRSRRSAARGGPRDWRFSAIWSIGRRCQLLVYAVLECEARAASECRFVNFCCHRRSIGRRCQLLVYAVLECEARAASECRLVIFCCHRRFRFIARRQTPSRACRTALRSTRSFRTASSAHTRVTLFL
jgi:hypothetical protein